MTSTLTPNETVLLEGTQTIEPAVEFTPTALRQVLRAMAKRPVDGPPAFLRLAVQGGGCSGLKYVMEPDTEADERDRTWTLAEGLRVVIDTKSLTFLQGMVVDYDIKNLMEGGFVYKNPNAARSCGCGTSFTPA